MNRFAQLKLKWNAMVHQADTRVGKNEASQEDEVIANIGNQLNIAEEALVHIYNFTPESEISKFSKDIQHAWTMGKKINERYN
jgi:hypothetical protein